MSREIEMNCASGARVEISADRGHEPGDVKFSRNRDGTISVTGSPNPVLVAKAIRRAKRRKAETRAPIGGAKADAMRARMRAKLARAGA